jgi:hypothetical protein
MSSYPVSCSKRSDQGPIETALFLEVDILKVGVLTEFRLAQPHGDLLALAACALSVNDQAKPLLETQGGIQSLLRLFREGVGHSEELQGS